MKSMTLYIIDKNEECVALEVVEVLAMTQLVSAKNVLTQFPVSAVFFTEAAAKETVVSKRESELNAHQREVDKLKRRIEDLRLEIATKS